MEEKETKPKKEADKKRQSRKKTKAESENIGIDLDSFDWGNDCKLSEKQKYFCIWYTCPGKTYHNAYQSAVKAGYTKNSATVSAAAMRKRADIAAFIKKFDAMYVKESLDDFYHNAMFDKITRATFDVADFYEIKTYMDKDGNEREYLSIKAPSDLTPEQRKCIDGIKINNNGTPSYEFASKTHETEFLMKMKEKLDGDGGDDDSFQVETTAEIIKGNLQVKTKVLRANAEITEVSELNNKTEDRTEED